MQQSSSTHKAQSPFWLDAGCLLATTKISSKAGCNKDRTGTGWSEQGRFRKGGVSSNCACQQISREDSHHFSTPRKAQCQAKAGRFLEHSTLVVSQCALRKTLCGLSRTASHLLHAFVDDTSKCKCTSKHALEWHTTSMHNSVLSVTLCTSPTDKSKVVKPLVRSRECLQIQVTNCEGKCLIP